LRAPCRDHLRLSPLPFAVTQAQYAAQKEAEEAGKANGTSSQEPAAAAAAAAAEANGVTDADGQPVSREMATMLAVDSKRASTAAIRAQVRSH
jgi:hypothetical protein